MKSGACVVIVVLAACNTSAPVKDTPREAVDAAMPSATASASTSASAAPRLASPQACTSDADCRTWSSYCAEAPCACRALAKGESAHCLGPESVRCFVDPCGKKTAACQDGRCVIVSGSLQ